jgi:hypothetical protein
MERVRLLFGLVVAASVSTGLACKTLEAAAAQDPQRCERDPACAGHQEKSKDCVTACVDNPDCIERCREVRNERW